MEEGNTFNKLLIVFSNWIQRSFTVIALYLVFETSSIKFTVIECFQHIRDWEWFMPTRVVFTRPFIEQDWIFWQGSKAKYFLVPQLFLLFCSLNYFSNLVTWCMWSASCFNPPLILSFLWLQLVSFIQHCLQKKKHFSTRDITPFEDRIFLRLLKRLL